MKGVHKIESLHAFKENFMSQQLQVFLLSMIPIIEQRGAIPLGFVYNMEPMTIFLLSLFGSLVPSPFILLLFKQIYKFLSSKPFFSKLVNLIDHKIAKNSDKLDKRKEIGLILFVAIPLPTTGIWTGSAVAAFLGLDFKKSLLCNFIGAVLSATIITIICLLIPGFFTAKTIF
jgi:uncharacterized membrane protein